MKGKGTYYIVDPKLYAPVEQACILIKTAVRNTETSKFMAYVLSPRTKVYWEKYGYSVPR